MTDRTDSSPTSTADALLDRADALHDDEPQQALAMLHALDVAALSTQRLPRLAFLLDHVLGEKLGLWAQALERQRALVRQAGGQATPALLRHAAIAAQMAGDAELAARWTQALADSADAPLARARTLVSFGAAAFSTSRLAAAEAGRLAREALEPLTALLAEPADGLDTSFGTVANNLASELLDRPFDDLAQPELHAALALCARHAQRFWERGGTWVNRERAHYLGAMAANALGRGADAVAQARAGLALLDEFDAARAEDVDRAFLELELSTGLRLCGAPGSAQAQARARALALAARFGDAGLDRWFAGRIARNEALAGHYGR